MCYTPYDNDNHVSKGLDLFCITFPYHWRSQLHHIRCSKGDSRRSICAQALVTYWLFLFSTIGCPFYEIQTKWTLLNSSTQTVQLWLLHLALSALPIPSLLNFRNRLPRIAIPSDLSHYFQLLFIIHDHPVTVCTNSGQKDFIRPYPLARLGAWATCKVP